MAYVSCVISVSITTSHLLLSLPVEEFLKLLNVQQN